MNSQGTLGNAYKIFLADESMLEKLIEFDRRMSWEFVDDEYKTMGYEEYSQRHREVFMELYKSPGRSMFIVAEDEQGSLAGSLWLKESWDTVNYVRHAYILDIQVAPAHQGKGLGGRLLEEAVRLAKELGIDKIALRVELKNKRAIKFYLKHGFKPIAITMELKI